MFISWIFIWFGVKGEKVVFGVGGMSFVRLLYVEFFFSERGSFNISGRLVVFLRLGFVFNGEDVIFGVGSVGVVGVLYV